MKHAVTPTRKEDFPLWYLEVIKLADLAEHSPVRGCMIIKPKGFSLWENIQRILDQKFKDLGIENAYFPLFIPVSFLEKEAKHVEGFAQETAVVTHARLEKNEEGKLIPTSPLEELVVVRPTSEMIIGASFAKWIASYRDLPMKVNQWCNVVRWEMRPRLFLRTSEFLWHEGHSAHATGKEAKEFALSMLRLYVEFAKEYLAMPAIAGQKSRRETFPGAEATYTFEGMMQDGKALQMGTSHYMGTNFSKASGIKYLSSEGEQEYAHTTSFGVTTRLIGAMIMMHGDDDGFIQPPRIATRHIVIIPSGIKEETKKEVMEYCQTLKEALSGLTYFGSKVVAYLDDRDLRSGEKSWDAIKKGYPLRIEVGPRDIEKNQFPLFFRSKGVKESIFVTKDELLDQIGSYLDQIHEEIYHRALVYRQENTTRVVTLDAFERALLDESFPGKFILAPFHGDEALEAEIQKKYGVTIRCFPHEETSLSTCLFTKQQGARQAIFAKSY